MKTPIYLPDHEVRCRHRAMPCSRETICARALADLPAKNATVGDLSLGVISLPLVGNHCAQFIHVATAIKPVAGPVVKPPIGGTP